MKHVVRTRWRAAVKSEFVVSLSDGAPLLGIGLERCFFLPVLNQVLDQELKLPWGPVGGLGFLEDLVGVVVIGR